MINFFRRIWKDSVWSSVIATSIFAIFTSIWANYNREAALKVLSTIVVILNAQLSLYVILIFMLVLGLTNYILQRKKKASYWNERLGNYTFRELYTILQNTTLPVSTNGMRWAGIEPPKDNLLTLFHMYFTLFSKGITIDDPIKDGGYIYGILAPSLVGYGLLEKTEIKNIVDSTDNKYQASEMGYRFYSLLEKNYIKNKK